MTGPEIESGARRVYETMRLIAVSICLLLVSAVPGCDKGAKAEAEADAEAEAEAEAKPGTEDRHKNRAPGPAKTMIGVWTEDGDGGELYELSESGFKTSFPGKEGLDGLDGTYTVEKVDGTKVTIQPSIDLGEAGTLPGDAQIITVIDKNTIERRNSTNGLTTKFKRKTTKK